VVAVLIVVPHGLVLVAVSAIVENGKVKNTATNDNDTTMVTVFIGKTIDLNDRIIVLYRQAQVLAAEK